MDVTANLAPSSLLRCACTAGVPGGLYCGQVLFEAPLSVALKAPSNFQTPAKMLPQIHKVRRWLRSLHPHVQILACMPLSIEKIDQAWEQE